MNHTVYHINKGIGQPVEFRGLQGTYILIMGLGLGFLLVLSALLYVLGANIYFGLVLTLSLGASLGRMVYRLNRKFGSRGLGKRIAAWTVPRFIRCGSRQSFLIPKTPLP